MNTFNCSCKWQGHRGTCTSTPDSAYPKASVTLYALISQLVLCKLTNKHMMPNHNKITMHDAKDQSSSSVCKTILLKILLLTEPSRMVFTHETMCYEI
jgi:hypothetical protein